MRQRVLERLQRHASEFVRVIDARDFEAVRAPTPRLRASMADFVVVEGVAVQRQTWMGWLRRRWIVQDKQDLGLFHVTPVVERDEWPAV